MTMAKTNKAFDLEHQYQLYLQRMDLRESEMHPVQRVQLKQTFFGASGQILMLLRNELAELPEDEAVDQLESMIEQVLAYFQSQN